MVNSKSITVITGFYIFFYTKKTYKFQKLPVCDSCFKKDLIMKSLLALFTVIGIVSIGLVLIFAANQDSYIFTEILPIMTVAWVLWIIAAIVYAIYNGGLLKKIQAAMEYYALLKAKIFESIDNSTSNVKS